MKAISIKYPWAGFILEGKKTIELRSWRTRYRGPVLIHRSGPGGGIVGIAEIADVIAIKNLDHFRSLVGQHHAPQNFYQAKLFGWVLKNARPVEFVPCKGRLGLWEPGAEIMSRLTGDTAWRGLGQ